MGTVVTAVVAHAITHRYGERVALADVSLAVDAGELCLVTGHNGSGKSTLLRILAGLQRPSAGLVRVAGQVPGTLSARAAVAYAGDTPVLYDDLSVRQHLEFTARLHGVRGWRGAVERAAVAVAIHHRLDDLPHALSRGLRQRAALALAFVRPFDVLVIDEPFVGLDDDGRAGLVAAINDARGHGSAVILATHDPDTIRARATVLRLQDGHHAPPGTSAGDATAQP